MQYNQTNLPWAIQRSNIILKIQQEQYPVYQVTMSHVRYCIYPLCMPKVGFLYFFTHLKHHKRQKVVRFYSLWNLGWNDCDVSICLQQILITQWSEWVIRLRWWWSRNDLTIDGWQLVALVSVYGRGSLLDVDGLLHLAFHSVLFSV